MPELPEVELIKEYIHEHAAGKTIAYVESLLPRMWRNCPADVAETLITGQTIEAVKRRGKYLIITWQNSDLQLIIHLKLTGRLIYRPSAEVERFDRILFHFTDGTMLAYGDVRTLGALYVFESEKEIDLKAYLNMGVEPLSRAFTSGKLYELTRRSSMPIKPFLLGQQFVAGIGNIYADEALFLAHVMPTRPADSLSEAETKALHRALRKVLRDSLANGGTSFRDYKNGAGGKGQNQEHLLVYGRGGKPCVRCKRTLQDMTLRGRHTVFCGHCQH